MYLFRQSYQQQSMVRHPNYSKFSVSNSGVNGGKSKIKSNISSINILFYGYDIEKMASEFNTPKLVFQENNIKDEISSIWVD